MVLSSAVTTETRVKSSNEQSDKCRQNAFREVINNIFLGPPTEEVVISKFAIDMTKAKLKSLSPCTWLNDEVINFYFDIIKEKYPQYYCFNSFFYSRLVVNNTYNYNNVRRWTKILILRKRRGYSSPWTFWIVTGHYWLSSLKRERYIITTHWAAKEPRISTTSARLFRMLINIDCSYRRDNNRLFFPVVTGRNLRKIKNDTRFIYLEEIRPRTWCVAARKWLRLRYVCYFICRCYCWGVTFANNVSQADMSEKRYEVAESIMSGTLI